MPRTYKSEALAVVHEMIEGLHEAGAIDKRTLREFDEACLAPAAPLMPEEIKAICEAQHVSQPVFARYLNVSKNLVSGCQCHPRNSLPLDNTIPISPVDLLIQAVWLRSGPGCLSPRGERRVA